MASVGTKYIHLTLNFAETVIIASQTPGKSLCLTTVHGLPTGFDSTLSAYRKSLLSSEGNFVGASVFYGTM